MFFPLRFSFFFLTLSLNSSCYFVREISIGILIKFHIHLTKFRKFNVFLKHTTSSIEFCQRGRK